MSGGGGRGAAREPVTLHVEYADAAAMAADWRENVSRGGTFVLTTRELEVGAPVRVVLTCPGLRRPLPLDGIVRSLRGGPPEERGIDVAFDRPEADEDTRLEELMRRIAAGDPDVVARALRVLVVEDNPHVAGLIRDGLTGESRRELGGRVTFRFEVATNGREAMERLAAHPFDLLFVDIYLPVLDGAQVIRQVRADPRLRALPIVAVSAGGASAREAALEAGADLFLEKPMRLAHVVAAMRRLLAL